MGIIANELMMKDIMDLKRKLEPLERNARSSKKEAVFELDTVKKAIEYLENEKKFIHRGTWTSDEAAILQKYLLITAKPTIYLINFSAKDYTKKSCKKEYIVKIKQWVKDNDPGALMIAFSADFEKQLMDCETEEAKNELLADGAQSALQKIIKEGFKSLGLEYFFTAGEKEARCWVIRNGYKAPQAAGRIHTDFEKGFIKADVMKFDDLKNLGTVANVKAEGKFAMRGKEYVVEDGDIILFKFNKSKK